MINQPPKPKLSAMPESIKRDEPPVPRHRAAGGDEWLGMQVHRSALQSAILICVSAATIGGAIIVRAPSARIILSACALVVSYVAVLTILGFRYTVTTDSLRIAWGFQGLKRLAATDILEVSEVTIRPIAEWGGYGLRFRAGASAFILKGKAAVKVVTNSRSYFLGTDRPGDLLNLIRRMHPSPGAPKAPDSE